MDNEISPKEGMRRVKDCFERRVWLCRDGTEIPVSELTQKHLENIFLFIVEHGSGSIWGYANKWYMVIVEEMANRVIKENCK
jgi:hypothetical protein